MRASRAFIGVRTLPVVVACSLPAIGLAAEFTTSAAVAPSIAYTDNVCLSDKNKQDAWVGLLTPSGSIKGEGNKADFNVRGSVQFNTLTDSQLRDDNCAGGSVGNREQFAPSVDARGTAILVDDWVKFNATGRANQNEASPFIGGGGDSLDGNGNTNTYYRYSLSPVLSRRLKDVATYNLRYTYDEVINTQDEVSDSTSDSWATNLQGGKSSQISWNLFGNYREVSYSDDDLVSNNNNNGNAQPRQDTELKSAGLELGYQINRDWQVNGTSGYEWNDYQTYNDEDTSGIIWDAGVRWTPSARTTVNAGIGERAFGTTPRLSVSHRHKRSTFSAEYSKSISFGRDILTQGNDFNQNVGNFSSLNSQSPIIDERFTAGYMYSGRRASVNFIGSHSNQTQEDNGLKSTFDNLALTYAPLVPRPYSLSGTVGWNNSDPRSEFDVPSADLSDSYEAWTTDVTLGRTLNNRMDVSLNYRYTDQQSDSSFNDYQENRVMATLNIRL
jgi:hypothetical protein